MEFDCINSRSLPFYLLYRDCNSAISVFALPCQWRSTSLGKSLFLYKQILSFHSRSLLKGFHQSEKPTVSQKKISPYIYLRYLEESVLTCPNSTQPFQDND